MVTRSPLRRTAAAFAVAVALVAALAGCGGSSGSDGATDPGAGPESASDVTTTTDGDAITTTVDDADGGDGTTTTAADEAHGGGDLVGTWMADAGDILGANTANLGGVSFECTGPVTLEFSDDGTFHQTSTATCTIQSVSATATIDSSGSWRTEGDQVVISDATSNGTMEMMGQTQPVDAGLSDGTATYEVDGDTLSVTFTVDPVGTVTQLYQRA